MASNSSVSLSRLTRIQKHAEVEGSVSSCRTMVKNYNSRKYVVNGVSMNRQVMFTGSCV